MGPWNIYIFFFLHFGDNSDSKVTSMQRARPRLWLAEIKGFLLKAFDHKETYCYVTLDDHCLYTFIHYLDAGIFLKTSLLFRRLKKNKTHDKTWRKRSLLQFASLKPSWCQDRILRKQTCFLRGSLSPWWRNSGVTGFQRTPAEVKHTGTPLSDHTFSSRGIPQPFFVAWNIEQCEITLGFFVLFFLQVHQNKWIPPTGCGCAPGLWGEQDSDARIGAACEPDGVGGPRRGLLQVTLLFYAILISQRIKMHF